MHDVIVLGAGMVGVSTALALQARGRSVVLMDRGAPGRETSHGNAGIIQVEAAEPYAMPRDMADLARIALRKSNDVNWHVSALPAHAGPLWQYFRNSARASHREIARVYSRLTARASRDHDPLIEAAGAQALIRRDGFRQAYRDARAFALAATEAGRLERDYGVASVALDAAALGKAEPTLLRPMAGAIHWTGPWTCSDPGGLVAAYAGLFAARGGTFASGDALSLQRSGAAWSVRAGSTAASIDAQEAVIALGPWSAVLCRRFGFSVPLFSKRGYHLHYRTNAGPDLPFIDVAFGAALAPMRSGLRITTGAEIAGADAAFTPVQLDRAAHAARELFAIGEPVEDKPWMGRRPCMPDMLPVVGAIPGTAGLWANFGHGHQGFTLGPTTAALLADEMTGEGTAVPELGPAHRFGPQARRRTASLSPAVQ